MYQPGPSLTFAHARRELEAGLAAVAAGQQQVDLSTVREADSTAVATLLAWQRAAQARGAALSLVNLPSSLSSLAELYGVAGFLVR